MSPPAAPSTPEENLLPALAAFLAERREEIMASCLATVRQNPKVASADDLDYQALADHLPKLLEDLAGILRGDVAPEEATRDAESHGQHRWEQDYSLAEVTRELGIVSRLVLELGLDAFEEAHPGAPRAELRRARACILRFFEDTVAASVRRYAHKQLERERTARSEAERANRIKDEFLATLSHELRTPLNAILGWAHVLRGDLTNPAEVEQGLLTIGRNARAQARIIDDLLDMSQIISGKVRLEVQRLDLVPVIEAAIETARPAAEAKGIRLQPRLEPAAGPISGDPGRLQQVFWNLLSNAVKFTPQGGQVSVSLNRANAFLEVSVMDSGEGIAPEFLARVFERFSQADASTTRRHGGLGLGLAIVKQLVELHGGTVGAESGGLGQGTTFYVSLPLGGLSAEADPAESARPPLPEPEGALSLPADRFNLRGVKVLAVDDEPDSLALVKRLLENREASVRTAGSAAQAMELIESERFDVLVSDIGMPGEDGHALMRRVRALGAEQGGATPAIALTAYVRPEDRLKAIAAGFQMHMSKPLNVLELIGLVARLAGRKDGP